jgi:hypothetical protein
MRVRTNDPFRPLQPEIPDEIPWQDWISSDGLLFDDDDDKNNKGTIFKRTALYGDGDNDDHNDGNDGFDYPNSNFNLQVGLDEPGNLMSLDSGVIAEILAATHAMHN